MQEAAVSAYSSFHSSQSGFSWLPVHPLALFKKSASSLFRGLSLSPNKQGAQLWQQ